ncbi:MAG: hypothetical protein V4489_05070 [Chlamydiota bacterium]
MNINSSSSRPVAQRLNLTTADKSSMATRVQSAMAGVQQEAFKSVVNELKLECAISRNPIEDPVITDCNHIFEKSCLELWLAQNAVKACPTCLTAGRKICTPIPNSLEPDRLAGSNYKKVSLAYNLIWSEKSPENPHADLYFRLEALNKKLNSKQKNPLVESDIEKIIKKLNWYQEYFPDSKCGALLNEFEFVLKSNPLQKEELRAINELKDPEEKITRYNQILANDPYQFQVYTELALLLRDPIERSNLLLDAAYLATNVSKYDLAAHFQKEADTILPSFCTISPEDLKNPKALEKKLPPVPRKIQDFLNKPCPIWGKRKRSWSEFVDGGELKLAKDTHRLIFIFSKITAQDGSKKPLTIRMLNALKPGWRVGGSGELSNFSSVDGEWAVLTKEFLPGSKSRDACLSSRDYQKGVIKPTYTDYELPSAFDLTYCSALGERLFYSKKPTYAFSKDMIGDTHICIGEEPSRDGYGLNIQVYMERGNGESNCGIIGRRKF